MGNYTLALKDLSSNKSTNADISVRYGVHLSEVDMLSNCYKQYLKEKKTTKPEHSTKAERELVTLCIEKTKTEMPRSEAISVLSGVFKRSEKVVMKVFDNYRPLIELESIIDKYGLDVQQTPMVTKEESKSITRPIDTVIEYMDTFRLSVTNVVKENDELIKGNQLLSELMKTEISLREKLELENKDQKQRIKLLTQKLHKAENELVQEINHETKLNAILRDIASLAQTEQKRIALLVDTKYGGILTVG